MGWASRVYAPPLPPTPLPPSEGCYRCLKIRRFPRNFNDKIAWFARILSIPCPLLYTLPAQIQCRAGKYCTAARPPCALRPARSRCPPAVAARPQSLPICCPHSLAFARPPAPWVRPGCANKNGARFAPRLLPAPFAARPAG
jgi:hypothetical protein